jgi:hypothetical protein
MNLLGVDVGFSALSLTTGLAWRIGDEVGMTKTGTGEAERPQWSQRPQGCRRNQQRRDYADRHEHVADELVYQRPPRAVANSGRIQRPCDGS